MAKIAVQIGHVNGKAGAAHEEETLKLIFPDVVQRLWDLGHTVNPFDGSLQNEPGNWQNRFDVAVFLHCDSFGASNSGYSIGYWEEEHPGSEKLARVMKDIYGAASGLPFVGYNITVGEHHYYGNRRFTHGTKCVLIELGFVSNPAERRFLQANSHRLAYAVADSISLFGGGSSRSETARKEVEMQSWQYDNVTKVSKIDCYKDRANYHVTTKGTSPVVTFEFEGHRPLGGGGTTEPQDVSGIQDHNIQDLLKQDRLKSIKGSYALTVTSANPITISIREVPK